MSITLAQVYLHTSPGSLTLHDVLRLTLDGDTQLVAFVPALHADAIHECTRSVCSANVDGLL